MWGLFLEEPERRQAMCECAHSEFVHADVGRHCLYAGCECPTFRSDVTVILAENPSDAEGT